MHDVNDPELYTFVVFDVLHELSDPRHQKLDGHLVHSNTNFKTFTDFEKQDPNGILPRSL